jgi:methyl coenzyme M reductase subunit C-like uncharacterized protein (methanogenesis marker protein 7)
MIIAQARKVDAVTVKARSLTPRARTSPSPNFQVPVVAVQLSACTKPLDPCSTPEYVHVLGWMDTRTRTRLVLRAR